MDIKKIVVGIDFSEESESAVQHALNIARHTGAEVVLLHVGAILEAPGHLGDSVHATIKEWEDLMRQQLNEERKGLEEMCERLRGQGVELSHMVRDGFADTGLADAAEELGADLLIVGTHGRTGLKRFFLGSISERVIRLSRSNVMVARARGLHPGGYKRILVPTDFSPPAERALEVAMSLAAGGAAIDLVHFWQVPITATTPYAPFKAAEEALTSMRRTLEESAQESGHRLLDKHPGKEVEMTFHAIESAPAHGVQERLEEVPYDLVVTGSHGRRGLRRFLLGSVAELTVRHANCSVLVVHDAGEAEPDEAD